MMHGISLRYIGLFHFSGLYRFYDVTAGIRSTDTIEGVSNLSSMPILSVLSRVGF